MRAVDLNHDGKADLIGRVPVGVPFAGQWFAAMSNGSKFTTQFWNAWNSSVPFVDTQFGDVNGDGKIDMVGRVATGSDFQGTWWASISTATMDPNFPSGFRGATRADGAWAPINWVDVSSGDLNGDGKMDVIGRVASTDTSGFAGQWWAGITTATTLVGRLGARALPGST